MAKENSIGEDIAVIKNQITNLSKSFDEFKNDNKALAVRLESTENNTIKTSERVSNLAIFQSVFSIIIGAIATYLGVSKQ
ncbi:MAG: hypothetical protein UU63_C0064G0006 [Candidatus Uhrbacteria bacterium GW2011_GWF2_41_430]|nr:MAG: hypothetical protein UU63_C0064G0006 [Candidatus Uhrbacteria bacterium GW2011_GWF2_41_430]